MKFNWSKYDTGFTTAAVIIGIASLVGDDGWQWYDSAIGIGVYLVIGLLYDNAHWFRCDK